MKEKFREFFAKHRHLIVISLILAILLVFATALAMRKSLERDIGKWSVFRISVSRQQTGSVTLRGSHSGLSTLYGFNCCTTQYQGAELRQLCSMLNREVGESVTENNGWEARCELSLRTRTGKFEGYILLEKNGSYRLRGTHYYRTWELSEEGALALLAYASCSHPAFSETPRELICEADNIVRAELTTCVDLGKTVTTALSEAQIETLCAFLGEHLLQQEETDGNYRQITVRADGWLIEFRMADGYVYRLQYLGAGQYRLLFGAVPEGETRPKGHRVSQLEKENVFSSLPELLEEVP